jgi:hypothetical protein
LYFSEHPRISYEFLKANNIFWKFKTEKKRVFSLHGPKMGWKANWAEISPLGSVHRTQAEEV